jgi:hypothetical protein
MVGMGMDEGMGMASVSSNHAIETAAPDPNGPLKIQNGADRMHRLVAPRTL